MIHKFKKNYFKNVNSSNIANRVYEYSLRIKSLTPSWAYNSFDFRI